MLETSFLNLFDGDLRLSFRFLWNIERRKGSVKAWGVAEINYL